MRVWPPWAQTESIAPASSWEPGGGRQCGEPGCFYFAESSHHQWTFATWVVGVRGAGRPHGLPSSLCNMLADSDDFLSVDPALCPGVSLEGS